MDGVAETFSTYRFVLSLALVVGGIVAIWFGYRLFATGAGTAQAIDKFDFKNNEVKISAAGMSVGAVLMLTSSVWSYFAYSSFPKLEANRDTIKIGGDSDPGRNDRPYCRCPCLCLGQREGWKHFPCFSER